MVICSAPGKIYLFGEHAVVYGYSAVCCAIDIRTRVQAERCDTVIIESVLGRTGIDHEVHPYVSRVIERIQQSSGIPGVRVCVDSALPLGSGLGSSAAVTVATAHALDHLFGLGLTLEEIAALGHEIEKDVQGNASPTDTYVSTMGGVVMIPERRKLPALDRVIVIGNTGRFSSTRELVGAVARLKDDFPHIIDPILMNIGRMSAMADEYLATKDYHTIGKLMDINHGLLDAIGVGCAELSSLVYASRAAGAIAAKTTGAGGGGCMVALADEANAQQVAQAIKDLGAEAIITRNTDAGVRLESE